MRTFVLSSCMALAFSASAIAQIAPGTGQPSPMQQMMQQQLQRLSSTKNSDNKMGMLMVVGQLSSCTQKQVGQPATQAFYQEMDKVGKTAEGYCKTGRAPEARTLVLSTLTAKKDDPVMKAVLNCYDGQSANIAAIGGPKIAADAVKYRRWAQDPATAQTEMKDTDICKPQIAEAAPVAPISAPVSVPAPQGAN